MDIFDTTNYEIFKFLKGNRPIDKTNLSKIIASVRKRNLLHVKPILVNEAMEIIDGQHRLFAARELEVPIYYMKTNLKPEDVIYLNANGKTWDLKDYAPFFCAYDNENYLKLREFAQKVGTDEAEAATFLMGIRSVASGISSIKLKDGTYVHPPEEREQEVYETYIKRNQCTELIQTMTPFDKGFVKNRRFLSSLFYFLKRSDVNLEHFMKRIPKLINKIHLCTSTSQYDEMFAFVYNHGLQGKSKISARD